MDTTWVAIIVGIVSSLITAAVTGAIWFAALKAWMARREERESATKEKIIDHETRLRVLERGPVEYVR